MHKDGGGMEQESDPGRGAEKVNRFPHTRHNFPTH